MKKYLYILPAIFLLLHACSTRKNNGVNRAFHGMTAKYNVLYNGNVALQEGIRQLEEDYRDDFWQILPIEPLHVDDTKIELPGNKGNTETGPFEKAEEKAVKAVQKHSIQEDGTEHNEQIDDAYFLLGKARYYSQRFVPALEAFNYIIRYYPKGDLFRDLQLWKSKTLIRLQNEEQAIETLHSILKDKKSDKKIKEQAYTALAMAYKSLDSIRQVILYLNRAVKSRENKAQHARNLFILGQLYRNTGKLDSSDNAFRNILKLKKIPVKYKIHAYMELAKNATDTTDHSELKEKLATLIKHYENKKYLGGLYYHAALLDFLDGDDKSGIEKMVKSTLAPDTEPFQKSKSYEALGNYYFTHNQFLKAGAYYDSLLAVAPDKKSKRIRKLKHKRKSLNEIIEYESVLRKNDSILHLLAMDSVQRRNFFDAYVKKMKKRDEIAAIQKENAERNASIPGQHKFDVRGKNNPLRNRKNTPGAGGPSAQGKWYFYNTQTKSFGKIEFQKAWGNRTLQDNWRWIRSGGNTGQRKTLETVADNSPIDKTKKYDVNYYLEKVESFRKDIPLMQKQNADALYNLGMLYKEKFKAYRLAVDRLERFIAENPKSDKLPPVYYHLYKITEKDQPEKAAQYKELLTRNYPDSRFTYRLLHPNTNMGIDSNSPEAKYESVYCDYDFYEKYPEVISACDEAISLYGEDPIVPKFELLKALALYKSQGKEPAKKQLSYVIGTYPKTDEAERAQELLDVLNGVKRKKKAKEEKIKSGKAKERKSINNKKKKNESIMKGLPGKKEMMDRINKHKNLRK